MNNPTLGQQVLITDTPLSGHIVALFPVDRHPYALVALEEGFYGFKNGQEVAYISKLACHTDNLAPLEEDTTQTPQQN